MKKISALSLIFASLTLFSQKTDPKVSIRVNGLVMQPVGHNYIRESLGTFGGFAISPSLTFMENAGLGYEFGYMVSDVKNQVLFGKLSRPRLITNEVYLFYKKSLTDRVSVTPSFGVQYFSLHSNSAYRQDGFSERGLGITLGARGAVQVDSKNFHNVIFGVKYATTRNHFNFPDAETEKFYKGGKLLGGYIGWQFNIPRPDQINRPEPTSRHFRSKARNENPEN